LALVVVLAAVPGPAEAVGYVFAPLWLIATWRGWRLGVHVEADGVKVVGFFASKRVPWNDIDRFELRPWQRYPYVGHVVLSGPRSAIPIAAITTAGGANDRHRRQAQEPIDRLNEALARWRSVNAQSDSRSVSSQTADE
jgi:hypothetical protein